MNAIEKGAEWPEALQVARAAFLAKDAKDALNPLAYRVLLMLPYVYRTWAKIRLKDLKPWIAAWTLPEMYAGIEGQGAADAAYSTALQIEHCMVNGVDFTGGASDVYKCFDQVQRPIIYEMLQKAGMPMRILKTYEKFQEGLTAYNTIAGGIGEGYKKPTSVPQGDPLSMMVTALQMRPWIMQMKSMAVKPRILADDLQIFATGPRHLEWFTHAFDKTHLHLQDMGARIAPQKSLTFSSNNTARQWLRKHQMEDPAGCCTSGQHMPRPWSPPELPGEQEGREDAHGQDAQSSRVCRDDGLHQNHIPEQEDCHQRKDSADGLVWV